MIYTLFSEIIKLIRINKRKFLPVLFSIFIIIGLLDTTILLKNIFPDNIIIINLITIILNTVLIFKIVSLIKKIYKYSVNIDYNESKRIGIAVWEVFSSYMATILYLLPFIALFVIFAFDKLYLFYWIIIIPYFSIFIFISSIAAISEDGGFKSIKTSMQLVKYNYKILYSIMILSILNRVLLFYLPLAKINFLLLIIIRVPFHIITIFLLLIVNYIYCYLKDNRLELYWKLNMHY